MYNKILFGLVAIVLITGISRFFIPSTPPAQKVNCVADVGMCSDGTTVGRVAPSCSFQACPTGATLVNELPSVEQPVSCTMDAMQCPDGSYVGRTGPKCEFVCPATTTSDDAVTAAISAKSHLITVQSPGPYGIIRSGDTVSGEARGGWFFEGSFPVVLVWSGKTLAEGIATAEGDWMTSEFVPFKSVLTFDPGFIVDATEGDGNEWPLGKLILQKDNPSGLPENDDSLEIPIRFAP